MPRTSKAKNSGSWLRRNRLEAGYRTAAALARKLGVTKEIVGAWERRVNRPTWGHMVNLAKVLHVQLGDLVRRLWGEGIGDPCPCGCQGKTVAPDSPKAKTLWVKLPCAQCKTERIYKRRRKGSHRRLCKSCTQLSERVEFTCVGYDDHGATRHARNCPRTIFLRPMDIHARQRDKERFPTSRFDASSRTFQCKWCGGAARLLTRMEKDARELSTEGGRYNPEKIQSRVARQRLLRKYHGARSPRLRATRKSQEQGRRVFAEMCKMGKHWPNKTKVNLVRHWSGKVLPRHVRFGLCLRCGKITITHEEKTPRFHQICYREWRRSTPEGRDFSLAQIRGLEARLPSPGAGQFMSEKNLTIAFSWAIQNRLGRKSYREIGKENSVHFTTVSDKIEYLMEKLPPPHLVRSRSRQVIKLLFDARKAAFPVSSAAF